MGNSQRIKPATRHWALYEQRPYQEAGLSPKQVATRLVHIALGTMVAALLGPFVPSRRPSSHIPRTGEEYVAHLLPSTVLALVIAVVAGYGYIGKPLKNQRLGYRLVGRFVLLGKQKVFGKSWLELPPDDTHCVGVPEEVFDAPHKGDTVEVMYSATKDFISVRKVMPPTASA